MGDDLIQRSVQFPQPLFEELSKIAKTKDISFAAIVREACIQYLDSSTPGLCPSCHNQNDPDAKYCSECSAPLTKETGDSLQDQINEIKDIIRQYQEGDRVLGELAIRLHNRENKRVEGR